MKRTWFTTKTVFGSACCLMLLMMTGAQAASAAPLPMQGSLNAADGEQLTDWLIEYGAPPTVAAGLVQQFAVGERWDSMTPGTQPTEILERTRDGARETIRVFEDGSRLVGTVEIPTPVPSTPERTTAAGVSGCTVVAGSGYAVHHNCLVSESGGYMAISFNADYTIVAGGSDTINAVRNLGVSAVAGSISNEQLVLEKPREDVYGPARAVARARYNSPIVSGDSSVTLSVGANSASSSGVF